MSVEDIQVLASKSGFKIHIEAVGPDLFKLRIYDTPSNIMVDVALTKLEAKALGDLVLVAVE